jgi:hypothetical protein
MVASAGNANPLLRVVEVLQLDTLAATGLVGVRAPEQVILLNGLLVPAFAEQLPLVAAYETAVVRAEQVSRRDSVAFQLLVPMQAE